MFKKRFGSSVKSRKDKYQKIDIILRVVAYNINRFITLGEDIILIFIELLGFHISPPKYKKI